MFLVHKISNNKFLLFLVPHFVYLYVLLNIYNANFNINVMGKIVFSEIIVLGLLFFLLTFLFFFVL